MAGRVVTSVVVVVLAGLALPALAVAQEKPKHQDPVELWNEFPVGTPTVQSPTVRPKPQANNAPAPKPAPVAIPPLSSATPAAASPSSSFPMAAVVGGIGGVLVLGLLGAVVLRQRTRAPDGPTALPGQSALNGSGGSLPIVTVRPEAPEDVFEGASHREKDGGPPTKGPPRREAQPSITAAVALPGVTWNTVGYQSSPPRRNRVSDGSQEETVVLESSAQPDGDGDKSVDEQPAVAQARVDIGEHINEIIRTAEEAARRVRSDAESEAADIRGQAHDAAKARLAEVEEETHRLLEEAQAYATETRQAVDTYATQKRRQADAEATRIQSEGESQARAVRESAEEMAKQIEAEARQTQTTLREETRAIESRLESLARGVKETGSQLDALLQRSKSSESLLDAISVDRQRAATREKDS